MIKELLDLILGNPPGASVSVPISATGFNSAAVAAAIEQAQREALAMFPADLLPDGTYRTKCNFGLAHIAHAAACTELDDKTADEQIAHASSSPGFRRGSWAQGVEHAKGGRFAFLGWSNPGGHGHVTSIAARDMQVSPSWGVPVPIVANVGKPEHQDFVLASAAFLEAMEHQIECFLWEPA